MIAPGARARSLTRDTRAACFRQSCTLVIVRVDGGSDCTSRRKEDKKFRTKAERRRRSSYTASEGARAAAMEQDEACRVHMASTWRQSLCSGVRAVTVEPVLLLFMFASFLTFAAFWVSTGVKLGIADYLSWILSSPTHPSLLLY